MKFEVQLEDDSDSEMFEDLARYLKYHPQLARFVFNPAGLTFLVGWLLFCGMMIGGIGIYLLDPEAAARMMATLLAEVFPGKEFAVPLGLALGLPPLIVFGIVFVQDLITTMWVYPLFYIFRRRHLGRRTFFGYFFAKMERGAKAHEAYVERYGAWGIFLFMLIPFAVNGPLMGAIIGKLAGIRTRFILPAVVGATALTTGYWTALWYFAYDDVKAFVDRFGGDWIAAGMLLIFALILLKNLLDFRRDLRRFRALDERRRDILRRDHVDETLILAEAGGVEPAPKPSDGPSHLEE